MRINPDLAHMTPARAKELLAGDIEGYRLPIIELIERQAAEIELLKDAGAWRGLTEQVQALQAEIGRLRKAGDDLCFCHGRGFGNPELFAKLYAEAIVAWSRLTS